MGRTPLHDAVAHGQTKMAAALQAAGASPNAMDKTGRAAVPTEANSRPPPAPVVVGSGPQRGGEWGAQKKLVRVMTVKYRYDPNGNMTRIETPRQVINYSYNPVGLLTGVRVKNKRR
jgi:YD repeat-containing protein